MAEDFQRVSWNTELEDYFKDTGEKAHGRAWCHKKAEELYSNRRTFIDLPVIVGSGAIAFLNGASATLFEDPKISSVALGVGSFLVGLLNTLGSYYGWAKRAEGHRIASLQYSRLYRFLRIEMNLPREERMTPSDLLKYVKDSDDRLAETSPLIPQEIIREFQKKFEKETIAKPEEANGLEAITIFQNPLTSAERKGRDFSPLSKPLLGTQSLLSPSQISKETTGETLSVSVPKPPKHLSVRVVEPTPQTGSPPQSEAEATSLERVGLTISLPKE